MSGIEAALSKLEQQANQLLASARRTAAAQVNLRSEVQEAVATLDQVLGELPETPGLTDVSKVQIGAPARELF